MSVLLKKQMCCLRIGYAEFLMPIDNGLKIIALMGGSIECQIEYSSSPPKYRATKEAVVELRSVNADQIILMPEESAAPTRKPLKRLPAP